LSLKQRFLLFVVPMALFSIGMVLYAQYLVSDLARNSIDVLDQNSQISQQIQQIKETLLDLEFLNQQSTILSFTFDPVLQQRFTSRRAHLDMLIDKLSDFVQGEQQPGVKRPDLLFLLQLKEAKQKLDSLLDEYQMILHDLRLRFPGMPLLEGKLLPAHKEFIRAVDNAIYAELENEDTKQHHETINLLKDLRYVWSQQIGWFRLFVANRSGIFGTPKESMRRNIKNRQLYNEQVQNYLKKLHALDAAGKLEIDVSVELEHMQQAFDEYEEYFSTIRDIYLSKNWRIDHQYLTEKVSPAFKQARSILERYEAQQQERVANDITLANAAASKISHLIWVSTAIVAALILLAYFMFEYLVRRPLQQVSTALDAEANGASFSPLISSYTLETKKLVNAFKNMQQQIHVRQLRLESVLDNAAEGIITYDEDGVIESVNQAAEKLFAASEEKLVGVHLLALLADQDTHYLSSEERKLFFPETGAVGKKQLDIDDKVMARRSDGEVFPMTVKVSRSYIEGRLLFMAMIEDVSERLEMIENLRAMAEHDALTKLYNRFYFMQELGRLVERTERQDDASAAILYIDLDNFKNVNDTLGHVAGDQLLVEVAALLKKRTRCSDLLARLGGDEFAIILYGIDRDTAYQVAESFRKQLQNYTFKYRGHIIDVGCSIGMVMIEAGITKEEVLARADYSCHTAKLAGRNKVHVHTEADRQEMIGLFDDIGWTRRIKEALEHDRFVIACQPIVDRNGVVCHQEMLLRMYDGAGNLIMPSGFIPPAERFGLMPDIDKWVIRHAVQLLRSASKSGDDRTMFCINLSAATFESEDIIEFITNEISTNSIRPQQIVFEITETVAMADLALAVGFLKKLKELGCRTALDDFGTGYSSFAYLKDLPVDYVKIDGAFVKDIDHDELSREIVQSMHNIAHIMGKQTIAEYVENEAVAELLLEIGIDYQQGYFIGKPEIPVEEQSRIQSNG
jgi:diguanylate cyclase (GGDEF)-like protein/PAS domain S-box-containing protein